MRKKQITLATKSEKSHRIARMAPEITKSASFHPVWRQCRPRADNFFFFQIFLLKFLKPIFKFCNNPTARLRKLPK